MKLKLTLIFFFITYIFYGQNQKKLDSLKKLLTNSSLSKNQAELNLSISKLIENKNRDSSLVFAKVAENIATNISDKNLLEKAFLQQGILFYKQQKDDIALTFLNKIDSLYNIEKVVTEEYVMTKIYRSEISKFSFTMPGVLKAKEYLLEAVNLTEIMTDEKLINLTKYRIGEWHAFMSQAENTEQHLDTAKTYFNNALKYYQKEKNYELSARVYYSLASVEATRKDYKAAELNYKKRLEVIKKTNDSVKIGEAYYGLATVFRKFKQPDKGLKYLDSAAIIFKNHGFSTDDRRKNLYKDYAYLYELKNDFKNAYLNMQKAIVLKDTLFREENRSMALELEAKYQTEKKEQEIALLTSQNKLAVQQKKAQRNLLLGGIGLASIAGLFLFFLYRNRQKTTKKLQELNIAKSNFFANISHEFRTPLTLISGPIQQQLKDEKLSSDERSNFEMIDRNTNRLLSLVDELLDISKIESGNLKLQISNANITSFIGTLADSFTFITKEKQVNYKTNIDTTTTNFWFDKDVLEKIITNLLSNAVKYTPEKGTIECNATIKNEQLYFEVKNSGKGMTKNELEKVFNRFYQINDDKKGTGIGLALVKELVTLHKGSISVNSNPNVETTFTVTLPINKESFNKNSIVAETPTVKEQTHFVETSKNDEIINELNESNDNPILLIVDDNADIRTYVSSIFKKTHTILQAKNGEEGIAVAIEHIPDIIISDIMMPVKDGIELSNTLKVDERTSHIPIILLTAKAGEENEIKGIKTGVDDYVTKPFNEELLLLKVEKLIENRKKLQERYSQELVLKPKDIAVTNFDEQFLEKLQSILENKLTESNFNVEAFSTALGMSRMQLHRKLKALTGLSTTEFIRSQRLKLAVNLLKNSDANVSEIGYTVGFNNHSYFTKCFKEAYGCSPSEYIAKH